MISAYKHVVVADPSRIRDTDLIAFDSLNNPIHYIWSYDNFRNLPFFDVNHCTPIDLPKHRMPYYAYERLTPALRLATILLGRARPFLERVMFAPMVGTTRRDQYPHPSLSEDWRADQQSSIALEVQLRDLARTYRIYYCPGEHPSQPGHSFCGATDILLPESGRSAIIYSGIDAAALEIVSRFCFDQRPVEEQQNLFLPLAITLVHELTHALHFKRYLPCINNGVLSRLPLGSEEPAYRPHERLRELGNRLEVEIFGGLIFTTYDAREDRPCEQYRLAPSTVRSFFQIPTWVSAGGQHRLLKLYLLPVEKKPTPKLRSAAGRVTISGDRIGPTSTFKQLQSTSVTAEMNIYVVAPLFVFLAILILIIPLLIIYRIYGPRLEAEYARTHGLTSETYPKTNPSDKTETKTKTRLEIALAAKYQNPFKPNRKHEEIDIEMLTVNGGKSNHSSVAPPQSPPRAQVKPERKQTELTRPARSTSHRTPKPYAATVTDLEDVPDTSAAATAAATMEPKGESEIGRSDTQKTYSSTASTIVSPEIRYESIRTATSGPLPTIKPNEDGFFEPERRSKTGSGKESSMAGSKSSSSPASHSDLTSASISTSTFPSHDATSTHPRKSNDKEKAQNLTETYQAHREKSKNARSPAVKFRDTLKAQAQQKHQKDRESEGFEDVDLGDEGVSTKDFGRSGK